MNRTGKAILIFVLLVLLSTTVAALNEPKKIETLIAASKHEFSEASNLNDDKGALLREMMGEKLVYENNNYDVILKARHFVPTKGISTALKVNLNKITATDPTKRTHVLLQFERIPTMEERNELKREGMELLAYIPNNTWYVSIPAGKANQIAAKPLVRAIDVIRSEYKISPYIQEGKIGDWVVDGDGQLC